MLLTTRLWPPALGFRRFLCFSGFKVYIDSLAHPFAKSFNTSLLSAYCGPEASVLRAWGERAWSVRVSGTQASGTRVGEWAEVRLGCRQGPSQRPAA